MVREYNRSTTAKYINDGAYLLGLEIRYIKERKKSRGTLQPEDFERLLKLVKTLSDIKEKADESRWEITQMKDGASIEAADVSTDQLMKDIKSTAEAAVSQTDDDAGNLLDPWDSVVKKPNR